MIRDDNTGDRRQLQPAIPLEWQYALAEIRALPQATPTHVGKGKKFQRLFVLGEMDRR